MNPSILSAIDAAADIACVDRALVKAIVTVETGGNPWLSRYEPYWKYLVDVSGWASRLTHAGMMTTALTERVNQSTSWGLMQVMGSVARELGHKGPLAQLCDPSVGLALGCMKLKELIDRYSSVEQAISAYNAGSPRDVAPRDGVIDNQAYVDKVLRAYK